MDWKRQLGLQLKEARHDCSLRQEDVSARANVHINMIGRYERGDSAPEFDVLLRLARVLDIKEVRIGEHTIVIRPSSSSVVQPAPKQLRLEFGRDYFFDGGDSVLRIQPSRAGLLIASGKQKVAS